MKKSVALILIAAGAGLAMRLPHLDNRPMHTDEAVHAYKFGELLQENAYKYDPNEYHGPTLNYSTLVPALLSGVHQYKDLTEWMLRIVPVFFGVLVILGVLLVMDGLGPTGGFWAAVFTALSTAMVFYSRYYIQEMLLVCFTFGLIGCGWRYWVRPRAAWAAGAGVFAGLMLATKETSVIALASMALSLAIVIVKGSDWRSIHISRSDWRHAAMAACAAVIIAVLFYSSFFANPRGIVDGVRTYANYAGRAGGNQLHIHPWYYYLREIGFTRYAGAPVWSEWIILVMAAFGAVAAIRGKGLKSANAGFVRFIALYTITMGLIYSAIPYKTPWSILSCLHGLVLLAGVGAAELILYPISAIGSALLFALAGGKDWYRLLILARRKLVIFAAIAGFILSGAGHLGWQAFEASYRYYTDTRNPYVYAQPAQDIIMITDRVKDIARSHPEGSRMPVEVICPGNDSWPIPWYLRQLERVGYWNNVDFDSPAGDVVLAMPSVEGELAKKWYEVTPVDKRELYVRLFGERMYMRPAVELRGYVKNSVYERWLREWQENRAQGGDGDGGN